MSRDQNSWSLGAGITNLKPGWIKTIESQPPYVYDDMAKQVKAGKEWQKIVADEGSLNAWIREIQRKRPKRKS